MTTLTRVVWCLTALMALACNDHGTFVLPTAPTAAAPAPPAPSPMPPAPSPPPPVASDFTRIELGQTIDRVIGDTPPECLGERGWPCQYFRLTMAQSGTLTVSLRYVPDTQPVNFFGRQGVDVTLESPNSLVWAQVTAPATAILTAPVAGGKEYQIVLWYTFPRLDYSLSTAMR